jgi:hypothetical protein
MIKVFIFVCLGNGFIDNNNNNNITILDIIHRPVFYLNLNPTL